MSSSTDLHLRCVPEVPVCVVREVPPERNFLPVQPNRCGSAQLHRLHPKMAAWEKQKLSYPFPQENTITGLPVPVVTPAVTMAVLSTPPQGIESRPACPCGAVTSSVGRSRATVRQPVSSDDDCLCSTRHQVAAWLLSSRPFPHKGAAPHSALTTSLRLFALCVILPFSFFLVLWQDGHPPLGRCPA